MAGLSLTALLRPFAGQVARRALGLLPVVVLVSALVFLLIHAVPGDPAELLSPEDASPADIDRLRTQLGLDLPVPLQFWRFISHALTGDFGLSFKYGEPVSHVIASHLPATLELALAATIIALAIGLPLGIWAGARPNSWLDGLASMVGFFGISVPGFWMGIMLILLVAGALHWLPSAGRTEIGLDDAPLTGFLLLDTVLRLDAQGFASALRHLALPSLTLGVNMVGIIMRVTRSAVMEAMHEDYVRTARATGQTERRVLWRHVLRNALVVITTVVGLELGTLLSGSIIVETVFVWPGTGSLLIEALQGRDYPLLIGLVMTYTVLFVLLNFTIDLAYAVIDPRIRLD